MAGEATIVSGVAGRYASALFELALESGSVETVEADLERFRALLEESDDLRRVVRSPVFTAEVQARAVQAVLERAGIGGIAGNMVALAARNRRLFAVPDMIAAFKRLAAEHRGEVSAQVTSAEPLSDKHVAALKEALKSVAGKDVALDRRVDPSLLGGLVVKLGSRMIDTSLRTRLNSLKVAMKEVG